MGDELYAWTKTEDHVQIAGRACGKGYCVAEGIKEQLGRQCPAAGCLLICSSANEQLSSSSSRVGSWVDCSALHLFNTFRLDQNSLVVVRCSGTTPDTLLGRHLYRSIVQELGLVDNSSTTEDGGLHWVLRLSRQLPADKHLTLILTEIDQLMDDVTLPACLPENVQLVCTSYRVQQPPGSSWAVYSLTPRFPAEEPSELFNRVEQLFSSDKVGAVSLALSIGHLTQADLEERLAGDLPVDELSSVIQLLEPVLIRWRSDRSEEGGTATGSSTIILMSRPAWVHARQRYSFQLGRICSKFTLIPFRLPETRQCLPDVLRWIARLFCLAAFQDLEREGIMAALFDWRAWRLSCLAGSTALQLWFAVVRRAAPNWLDSQLWLLEHNLPWLEQTDAGAQHLAAQLSAALKPFADKGSSNKHLWQLHQAAQAECDQFPGPVLVPSPSCWNWNHCSTPLERIIKVDLVSEIQLLSASPDGQALVVVTGEAIDPFRSVSAVTGRKIAAYNKGHSGRVTCIHVMGDSQHVISGSEDLTVIVWNLWTGNLILRIREHIAAVSCVSSVLSGRMIVSGGEDSSIMVFQWPGHGERLARIDHHRGPVNALAINYRQDVLVSGSQDGSICLWSLENWSLLNAIVVGQPVGHITLSTDDVFLMAVGLDDGLPRLYSLTTGSSLRTWCDLPIKVKGAVIVGGNGHSLAALAAEDGRLMCYDCHGGHLVHSLSLNGAVAGGGKSNRPAFCSRSDDPRLLYHSAGNGLKVWMLRYEEKRPTWNMNIITCLAASPLDGSVAATGDLSGAVQLWRSSNLTRMSQWNHKAPITVVTFDAAGLCVASAAEDGTCAVWNLDSGQTLPPTQVHSHRIHHLLMSPEWSNHALSCDSAETVVQWKLSTGETVRQWTSASSKLLDLAKNARWMAGSTGTNSVRLWSLEGGEESKESTVSHAEEILCLALTSDSRYLITGSKDSSLKMWEGVEKGGKLVQIMAGHSDHVTAVVSAQLNNLPAASPLAANTKQLVIVSGSRDGQLIIWDAQHGSEIHSDGMKRHNGAISCLKVSADGSVLVSGSVDGTVRVWNLRLGTSLSSFALAHPVRQIAMAPDVSKIWVRLHKLPLPAVLDLKHTPAVLIKPDVVNTKPASPVSLRKPPPTRRLLKKEISLDSYTWLKRYGAKSTSSNVTQPVQQPPASTPSVDSLMKLSRRNSFCNVPEADDDTV